MLALVTDFGPSSHYVGVLHGVVASTAPGLRAADLAHDVPPGDTRAASYVLLASHAHFPRGTTFLAVIDPGVGGERRVLLVRRDDACFVAPDNGLLSPFFAGASVHALARGESASPTFEARDFMAGAAARVALGETVPAAPCADPVVDDWTARRDERGVWRGAVVLVDRFGNLITSVPSDAVSGTPRVRVGESVVSAWARTYVEAPAGQPFAVRGSGGFVEVSVAGASAADALGAAAHTPVEVLP